jgi:NADPH:quinone reductase-like Zn-dependent oxidoreductase
VKAIVWRNYGSSEVLKCEEIEKPTPGDDAVLIKVRAASVNPLDWHIMRDRPYGVH